jgi:GNAT superfamily N-acetyltransferase
LPAAAPAVIEPLRPEHVPGARQVIRTVWREHFSADPEPFLRHLVDDDTHLADVDRAAGAHGSSGGTFLVTLVGGEVVGTGAVARVDDDTCELRRMFLVAEHRGRGLGRRMAERLIAFARGAGYRRMRLASHKRLLPSHALYRSLGFRPTEPFEHGSEAYALYMERSLTAGTDDAG